LLLTAAVPLCHHATSKPDHHFWNLKLFYQYNQVLVTSVHAVASVYLSTDFEHRFACPLDISDELFISLMHYKIPSDLFKAVIMKS
jgi:hypothetical protein